jgi:hypothetical protein
MGMNEEKDISVSPLAPKLSEVSRTSARGGGRSVYLLGVHPASRTSLKCAGNILENYVHVVVKIKGGPRTLLTPKQRIHSLLRALKERLGR